MLGFTHINPYFALAVLLVMGLLLIVPLVALTEIISSNFRPSYLKVIWVLIVLLINIPGAVLYGLIGRHQRIV